MALTSENSGCRLFLCSSIRQTVGVGKLEAYPSWRKLPACEFLTQFLIRRCDPLSWIDAVALLTQHFTIGIEI